MISSTSQDCSYTYAPFRRILERLPLKTMLEIGSLHGLDAIEVKRTYALDRVITIECNPECILICRNNFAPHPDITLIEVAAWHEDTTIPFYRVTESYDWKGVPTQNLGASSCFMSNDTWPYEKYHQEKIDVPARRLEGVLDEQQAPTIDLICMDAQGAELHALQGLGRYLDKVQAIVTELEIKPMYHGQTLFSDVSKFLTSRGFVLKEKNQWAKTAGDFLFVREAPSTSAVTIKNSISTTPTGSPVSLFTAEDAASAYQVAHKQAMAGRLYAADKILCSVLVQFPKHFEAAQLLGYIKERQKDFKSAIAAYELAIAINPGHAQPFTRRALLKFRQKVGIPHKARYADPAKNFVMIPSLGVNGRFGNQLLQYGLLRIYAEKINAQPLVPDWIGRDLFGHVDALIGDFRPTGKIDEYRLLDELVGRAKSTQANVEVSGYFCGNPSDWVAGKETFQKIFEPVTKVRNNADAALRRLLKSGHTLIALHLRRGDYGTGQFWIAPTVWYKSWLEQVWPTLKNPILYIATDDASIIPEFDIYKPLTAIDLGPPLAGVEFFNDHWIMRHADLLATSNSTFSGTAALLSKKQNGKFLRPDPICSGLRPYDPWTEKILIG